FAQHSNDVALVLTDMVMPVMDGAATIGALRKMKPGVKIIAATGYTDDIRHDDLLSTVDAVLKKPYTAGTLMKSITQVLENEPATT
ncbi:MAG TPA: response regulator, partial [Candidatus Kryptobacter bacterium]|nr:response regulator [Candidatus Kryptobacter bacterium]